MKIGRWLYEYRQAHKLSMQDVADKCGFSKTYVYMLEKGINNRTGKAISPTVQNMTKLAEMANMTLDELIVILDEDQTVILKWEDPKEEEKPLTAKELMQTLCQGDKEALAIVERLTLTEDGRLQITGADLASQAVLDHQVKGLISALKNAKLAEDGLLHFEFTPDRKE